jgi:hypothetical protein
MHFALDHGIANIKIKGKGPLVPFVVTEINGEKEVTRFFTNHHKDGLGEAIRHLKGEQRSHFAVLAYDGLLPIDNQKFNAVIVRGYARADTVGYTLAQRYVPSGFFSFFKLAGDKVFLGNSDSLLMPS